MHFLVAVLPIALLIVLIVVFRKNIIFSAATALVALLLAAVWWGVGAPTIMAAGARGAFLAVEIVAIIFGALLVVEVIRRQNLFEPLRNIVTSITTDYRVQTMLVALALVAFIEGVAGFGTPAIVAVPLLLALGFKPVHAVVLALVGDTVPVSFGAVGLPITYGIDSVVQPLAGSYASITADVVASVALFNIAAYGLLAICLLGVSVLLHRGGMRAFWRAVPFALLSGFAVSIPSYIVAVHIGPELASILGGLVGVFIIALLARHRICTPMQPTATEVAAAAASPTNYRTIWRALYPYVLLVSLLVATRLPDLPVGAWLQGFRVSTTSLFGTDVGYSIAPFYSAAGILLFIACLVLVLTRKRTGASADIVRAVAMKVRYPFVALLLVLAFAQIFVFSVSGSGQAAMPVTIAQSLGSWTGDMWPFVAPFVGALGSFVAGSATVSNLIFAGLQFDVANVLGFSPVTILSLQTIGASLGNMVALHNVVAALAIAGLGIGHIHRVVRTNLWPLFSMLVIVGGLGLAAAIFSA